MLINNIDNLLEMKDSNIYYFLIIEKYDQYEHSIVFQIMFQEYFNSQKSKINENNFLLLEMNIEIFIILFMIEEQFINNTWVGVQLRFQECS